MAEAIHSLLAITQASIVEEWGGSACGRTTNRRRWSNAMSIYEAAQSHYLIGYPATKLSDNKREKKRAYERYEQEKQDSGAKSGRQ
jgi:hypothetical protein